MADGNIHYHLSTTIRTTLNFGYSLLCVELCLLAQSHKNGEVLIPVPVKVTLFGPLWMMKLKGNYQGRPLSEIIWVGPSG